MSKNFGFVCAIFGLSMAAFGQEPEASGGGWRKFSPGPVEPSLQQSSGQAAAASPSNLPSASNLPNVLTMNSGTMITARIDQLLSSDRNHPGDTFTASLVQPLVVNGLIVARRGQTIAGRVADADKGGRVKGTSRLGLELTEMSLVDGQQIPVRTQLMQYNAGTSNGRDAAAIGVTTGAGAAIGAAAAGGVGAGIGAGAGAVASTIGVLLTRGHPTEVYPESVLTFRTLDPISISTERSAQAFEQVKQGDYATQVAPRPSLVQRAPAYYGGGYSPYGYGPGYWGPGYWPGYYGGVYIRTGPRFYGRGRR